MSAVITDMMYEFLMSQAISDRNKAYLTIALASERPEAAGVNSTSENFYDTINEAIRSIADANARIEVLEKQFNTTSDPEKEIITGS